MTPSPDITPPTNNSHHSVESTASRSRHDRGPHLGRSAHAAPQRPSTFVEVLRQQAHRRGGSRAFTFASDGEQQRTHLTFAQLDLRARAIAAELQSRGLQGQRALLLYPSGLDFIAAFFGCLYAGVIAVPAYPPRRNRNTERIAAIAHDAQAHVALSNREALDRLRRMVSSNSPLASIEWHATDEFDPRLADHWHAPEVDGDDVAFLQYTSGSTSSPKGVVLSHSNLMHNASRIAAAFGTSQVSRSVFWLPLYHDMGLIGGVLSPIYAGASNTLLAPAHFLQRPFRWLKLLSDLGAEIGGAPNFAYDLCVERTTAEERSQLDLSQWRLAFNGAEPVRAETMERFCEAFMPCGFRPEAFYPCYGLAESTLLVTGGDWNRLPIVESFDATALQSGRALRSRDDNANTVQLVSSGNELSDHLVRVIDPHRKTVCNDGRVGEIWVAGPSVAQGYWQQPQATTETFGARTHFGEGPFLRTGDLGFLLRGELFVTGRAKDLIIVRGVNHYPQDIEATVTAAHADVTSAPSAAFAVGSAGREELVVVAEVARRANTYLGAICRSVREQIATMHDLVPLAVVLLRTGTIPRTSSGKIQRYACREGFLTDSLNTVAVWHRDSGLSVMSSGGAQATDAEVAAPSPTAAPLVSRPAEPNRGVQADPAAVLAIVSDVAGPRGKALALDTNLLELGLDSLERMEIVARLEDHFGGRFPEEAVLGMETPRDVVRAIEQHLLGDVAPAAPVEISIGDYDFSQSPEYARLAASFALVRESGLPNPYFNEHQGITNDRTRIGGREYINWCSYNYLGMSGDPTVTRAAQQALERYGSSVSASRVVSGQKSLHRELEQTIADLIGAEDAIALVGGHATNETVIGHLFGPGDLILHDALSHNSIVQGCKLSGARRRAFPHNDFDACSDLLARYRRDYRRVLVVVEGVYSMDGDYCDLPRLVELKRQHRAYLMVDEAHSLGTMGATGRGMREFAGLEASDVDLWMGTLSKSLGSCGGYIAARREIVEYLKYTAPGFVYSVGLSPPNAAAALASLRQLQSQPERVRQLAENSRLFLALARQAELNTGSSTGTPIVPLITGSSRLALQLSHALLQDGINVQPILHPAVEERAARLRFFVTSTHTSGQIRTTIAAVADHLAAITAT